MRRSVPLAFAAAAFQVWGGWKAYGRLLRQARRRRIRYAAEPADRGADSVAVVLPVLDEARRLRPCLDALRDVGAPVRMIIVVDTGSSDDTPSLVREAAERDPRITLVEAGAPPTWWVNGKAWGLWVGSQLAQEPWLLWLDADVRLGPQAPGRLLATALRERLDAVCAAPRQDVRSAQTLLHASMLASLVLRVGLPGALDDDPAVVLANGQAFLLRREVLDDGQLWAAASRSRCEDVTVARILRRRGLSVASVETDDIAVAMYSSVRELWTNWPRSLALRESAHDPPPWRALATVAAVQGLPLPSLIATAQKNRRPWRMLRAIAALHLAARFSMALGVSRAYPGSRSLAALAPLADPLVAVRLVQAALWRAPRWRGRILAEVTP